MRRRDVTRSTEREASLVGACMLDGCVSPEVLALVTAADFANPRAAAVFEAMAAVTERGERLDFGPVASELEARGQLAMVGDDVGLAAMIRSATTSRSAVYYAGQVASVARRRRIVALGRDLIEAAESGDDVAPAIGQLTGVAKPDEAKTSELWRTGSSVAPRERQYLWAGRIRQSALTLIEGLGKVGKSTVMRAITTALTRGHALPDDVAREPVHVLWLTTEEDVEEDVVPALKAMGADLGLVLFRHEDAQQWTTDRIAELEAVIREKSIGLVVIDQLKDHLAEVKRKGEGEITARNDCTLLGGLARRTRIAIVGVRHWTKAPKADAVSRGAGPAAYSNVARSILQLARWPDGGLALATIGNGAPVATLALTLEGSEGEPHVRWGDALEITADDLAGHDHSAEQGEERTKAGQCSSAIRRLLADGEWRDGGEARKELVKRYGFRRGTIDRAIADPGTGLETEWLGGMPPRKRWRLKPDVRVEDDRATEGTPRSRPPEGVSPAAPSSADKAAARNVSGAVVDHDPPAARSPSSRRVVDLGAAICGALNGHARLADVVADEVTSATGAARDEVLRAADALQRAGRIVVGSMPTGRADNVATTWRASHAVDDPGSQLGLPLTRRET